MSILPPHPAPMIADPRRGKPAAAPFKLDPFAALLSYLVPGLGQIYQGRVAKGVLFLMSLYGLFFYGMYLGQWSNVFLADSADANPAWRLPRWATNLYNRPHFAGQFWIGAAAWPAILHYNREPANAARGPIDNRHDFFTKFEAAPSEKELNDLQRDGDKHWDLGWVYTVIAGVLNVLVIYDAFAGPAFSDRSEAAGHADGKART
jgi:TM2 domain-containing membrane protein YozV